MKDWSAIAVASGIEIPAIDMEGIVKPLSGLEEAFRPLVEELTFADEPATTFEPEERE